MEQVEGYKTFFRGHGIGGQTDRMPCNARFIQMLSCPVDLLSSIWTIITISTTLSASIPIVEYQGSPLVDQQGVKIWETVQDLFNVMGALYSSVLFLGINNAASIQPVVFIERTVYYREKATGMYASFPYAFAQGLVEIPYIAVQTLIYGCITYFMINFELATGKFFLYLIFMFLTLTYFAFYGMMAVGITSSQQLAAVVSSAFYSIWNLLSGFLIPKPKIPGWWIWFYYICPVAWTLRGLISSQLGDVESQLNGATFNGSVREFLESYLGYKQGFIGVCLAVLIGFSTLFFCVFAISIHVLNFQRR